MKNNAFATGAADPWCPGCGHTMVIRALQEALERLYPPHDVILVTDIGCIGMADGMFTCHTVHGLHGRSPALAAGIAMTLPNPQTKVVVLMGDGGAAIGLQHILDCARLNVDLTLIVCNNQNYGMTGGQHSAYTLRGVKTATTPAGAEQRPFDICELVGSLKVRRSRALATSRELSGILEHSLAHRGFALVETMNYCPSYAGKQNPEQLSPKAMTAFFTEQGLAFGEWESTTEVPAFRFTPAPRPRQSKAIPQSHTASLNGAVRILLAGSAGEGVQSAVEVFAQAAIRSGLEVVVKGDYPVTVGKGFSAATLQLSAHPILSPAGETIDVALISSNEGLRWATPKLGHADRVVLDATLERPQPEYAQADFRSVGARQSGFAALTWLLSEQHYFPLAALRETVEAMPQGGLRTALIGVLDARAASAAGV